MTKMELVINLNKTTGYELSYIEVMNYEKIKFKESYLQTHCIEFADEKYLDKFNSIVLVYDESHIRLTKDMNIKDVLNKTLEDIGDKVFTHKFDRFENCLINGLNNRLSNALLNLDIDNKVLEEFCKYDHSSIDQHDLKIFTNYLKLINIDVKYCNMENSTKYGAICFNLYNIEEEENHISWIAMFINTNIGHCYLYNNKRKVMNGDKIYYVPRDKTTLDYYIKHLIKAVNKVVFGNTSDLMITEK